MPDVIQRAFGIVNDATAGGSEFDDLAAGAVPDSTDFWPITGGSFDKGAELLDRDDEARGRRARTASIPFRQAPSLTVPVRAYPSLVAKALRKCLGGADSVSGGVAPYTHTLATLPEGQLALPAVHAQLIRDDFNQKMAGAVFESVGLSFPLDGEGTIESTLLGLYQTHDAGARPSIDTSAHDGDTYLLRDAQMFLGQPNEVQTVTQSGATAGTFTLTFDGQTTAGIAYNATAAAVQSALEALSNIGVGDVACTGGPLGTAAVSVEFRNALGNRDVAQMTADGTGLTGGTVTIATTTPGGVAIPNLAGFDFSFANGISRDNAYAAGRNVEARTVGGRVRKLWWPYENRVSAAQDVTYTINFSDTETAQELALDFGQIQKFVFEVTAGPLASGGAELMRVTIFAGQHAGGGPDDLSARDDIASSYEGTAFWSEADSADIRVEIVNDDSVAIV